MKPKNNHIHIHHHPKAPGWLHCSLEECRDRLFSPLPRQFSDINTHIKCTSLKPLTLAVVYHLPHLSLDECPRSLLTSNNSRLIVPQGHTPFAFCSHFFFEIRRQLKEIMKGGHQV